MSTIPTITIGEVYRVLAEYDSKVRANYSDDWDSLAAVAVCDDGLYGAFGEVLDVAQDLELDRRDPATRDWDPRSWTILACAFRRYQRDLLVEVGDERADAARADSRY